MFAAIFFTVILAIIVYYYIFINKVPKQLETIPSVSMLPFIWAIIRQKRQDEIQECLKGPDIYLSRMAGEIYIIITSPEYAKDLTMETEDAAPKRQYKPGEAIFEFFGNGLTYSNGDTWRTYRKLATPAFNNSLSPELVGETVMDLFTFMKQNLNRPIDIFETVQRTTIEVLGKLAFGYHFGCLKSEQTPHIISLYKFIIETSENPILFAFPWISKLPTERNRKFFKVLKEFDKFMFDIIETKRNEIDNNKNVSYNGRVDLLTSMLELGKQEGIQTNSKQLRDEMVGFFVAGHDTTSVALSTSLYYLAKYPEIQEKARAEVISILGNEPVIPNSDQLKEMKYINAIIKESLRILPPAIGVSPRKLAKPIKIGPYVIPENTICAVNIWQVHHHPEYWENPSQYNPERFINNEKMHQFSWMPFSFGPRNCIGQNFTLMEQRVILSMILLKYKWTLPENSINKDKILLETQFLLRPVDLKLVFTERF